MAEFQINRGIGSTVEFQGLKAQYLFIFIGGLLALFILFVILYLVGVPQWLCFAIIGICTTLLVWQTFSLNKKYGEHGLMKRQAKAYHPRYIISRKKISRLLTKNSKR
ncbi:MAG: DUF4133 domain-containing protein [Rikenellaceae bacterium]